VHKTRILPSAVVLVAALSLSSSARAHMPGLSVADFDVRPDGQVEAQLTFASADLLAGVELDRDRDGVITPDDVSAAGDDLRAFAMQGVGVEADGASCDASFRDASLSEADGLVLRATYACPSEAAEIVVTLFYLSGPLRGRPTAGAARDRGERGIARIVAGGATAEGVLTGDHRAIALRLPGKTRSSRHTWARLAAFGGMAGVGAGALIVAFLAWRMSRWREARAAWQNRQP
jgi:hypothetical protein